MAPSCKHFSSLKLTELEHLGKSLKIKKENLWKGHCEVVFESETISGNGSLVLARTIVDILWEDRTAVNFILKKYFTMTLLRKMFETVLVHNRDLYQSIFFLPFFTIL